MNIHFDFFVRKYEIDKIKDKNHILRRFESWVLVLRTNLEIHFQTNILILRKLRNFKRVKRN